MQDPVKLELGILDYEELVSIRDRLDDFGLEDDISYDMSHNAFNNAELTIYVSREYLGNLVCGIYMLGQERPV